MKPNIYYNAFDNVMFKFKVKDEKEMEYCLMYIKKYANKSVLHEIKSSTYPKDEKIRWLLRHAIYNDFEKNKEYIDPNKSYYYDFYVKDGRVICEFMRI